MIVATFPYHPFSFLLLTQKKRNKRKGSHQKQFRKTLWILIFREVN